MPKTTLVLQTLFLALTGWLMGILFLTWGLGGFTSLVIVIAYFLHPAIVGANLNAFHPIVMATPFLILFLLALEWEKAWLMVVSTLMICLTQENAIMTAMAMSVFPAMKKKYRFAGIQLLATTGFFWLTTKKIIPHFNESHILPYGHLYGSPLGATMDEIVKNGILHPILLLQTVLTPEKLKWLFFQTGGFFTLIFAPAYAAVALMGLIPNLLSTNASMLLFWGQYSIMGFPFFVIGAAAGCVYLKKKWNLSTRFKFASLWAPIFAVFVYELALPKVPALNPQEWFFRGSEACEKDSTCKDYRDVALKIPDGASVSGTENLMNHLEHRKRAYFFPVEMLETDFSILDKTHQWWKPEKADRWVKEMLEKGYFLSFENSHLAVYEKKDWKTKTH